MNSYVQTIPTHALGEGPHWNVDKQELLYVDINGQSIHRYVPGTGEHTEVRINEAPVGMVIPIQGQANKYLVAVGKTLQSMEWDGRSSQPTSMVTLFSVEPGTDSRFNDGKCDSSGRCWVGTMNSSSTANLYRVTNSIDVVQTGIGTSNGIAWNRDNTLMFYNDTATRNVDVFDFNNGGQGTISNRRTVYDFNKMGENGSPDGMTIDADGYLWVACWGGNQIIQVDPNTGRKLRSISLPAKNVTSAAFGGPNLDVMYVTTARDGMSDSERMQYPAAGSLIQITNVGTRGLSGGNNFRY